MTINDRLEPNIFVIFGGAGDLTSRKLMPAMFDLSQSHAIPAHFSIIAVDRVEIGEDAFRKRLYEGVRKFALHSNDATLFMRADQVEAAWQLLMPVLDAWKASPPSDFPNYAGGAWGPDSTQGLLVQQGHSWPVPVELAGGSPQGT